MRGTDEILLRIDTIMTGHKHQVLEALIRAVSATSRVDRNVKKIYIGIASGVDPITAMWKRYDEYKRLLGINEMIAMYQSASRTNCQDVESYLIDNYWEYVMTKNRRKGGGGREPTGPNFYVYLAIRRWGK